MEIMAFGVLLLLLGILGTHGKKRLCPAGCKCSAGPGGGDCSQTAECPRLRRWPDASEYPPGLDCLFVNSPKLRRLQPPQHQAGLAAIPDSIRRLDLSGSRLRMLPPKAFSHLSSLRVLNLEFNELEELPADAFHGLGKLKVLWLTGNHYSPNEREYKKMKVAGNRLHQLHPQQFEGLNSLQVLLLHHNRLETLPDSLFDGLAKLRVLKLLDNPFRPRLTRSHPAFIKALQGGVLQQLDLDEDSGDSLEDEWEETSTYLSDDFSDGPLPESKHREDL